MFSNLPDSALQCGAIFMSIIIEALPFVLLGSLLSGFLEIFLSPEFMARILPKRKFLRIFFGIFIGFFFPSCECGIVPIVNRFLEKKMPSYTAIPFLVTAPIINPIVLFATFIAFGNSFKFALLRAIGAIFVGTILGILLGFVIDADIVKGKTVSHAQSHDLPIKVTGKIWASLTHAVDEFFDTGRYLIFGSIAASLLQVYVPTGIITQIGHRKLTAILLMMLLAFVLSLCSEADAFIAGSLISIFGTAPIVAFLLFGPMVDIKNLLMMKRFFKTRFILQFVGITALSILIFSWVV
ncbi:putative two-component membrane permease complex subunit [Lactococcus hodotermopsidis]|uniref:Putative two-component membrane permease complex subunit n=1 Tax=Pseudolactococcus hodotermopsidis TaxID=2709157 RepID=A0A6A0BC08_9LACT|nr:permease [Lactococcus hodotermopsidis]GFH42376.1 putative two-component membrane permease complex subunit [Lactococcus hodotermopsidis]